MAVNKAAVKAPSGMIKFLCLALTIVVLVLARAGFDGSESTYHNLDHRWLTIITFGGYCIIFSTMIVTYLLGSGVPDKMEIVFSFVGCCLFIATGSVHVEHHSGNDTGLAMGSLSIITGIILFLDCILLAKAMKARGQI
ncbi:hypothetical protein TCAL_08169 [Tigriopus californicus]|uniref:MARVEL domain-containing protein n=1 Tax=Tigriopus californicus TaxID=6832 RepID=A0A553P804_TIGCA|nr:protein snakeskin-like [Tigriopus californicus]TRY73799.1 hypothetical protein TCAL_08169 [Tigriopus californicus]|eukprot:TCALIF_08169-PA protein Name:"Protein of unknown function" AED:0.19 eAED:0.19 QI:329/1/1/1/0.5/1/3/759/138